MAILLFRNGFVHKTPRVRSTSRGIVRAAFINICQHHIYIYTYTYYISAPPNARIIISLHTHTHTHSAFFLFRVPPWWHWAHNTRMTACLSPMFAAVVLARSWLWLIVGVFSLQLPVIGGLYTGGPTSCAITPAPSTANPAATARYPRSYGNSWFWFGLY